MHEFHRIIVTATTLALLSFGCHADPGSAPAQQSATGSQQSPVSSPATADKNIKKARPTRANKAKLKAKLSSQGDRKGHPALHDASLANEKAPATFKAKFTTTKGDFEVEAHRAWSPNGVDRFYNLVKIGFFDDVAFFRAIKGFMVQFGIHGNPAVSRAWMRGQIQDDKPGAQSNTRGTLTFAKTNLPNTRSTQLFINYGDNARLDKMGFTPIGKVITGMDVVDSLYNGYGAALGRQQGAITMKGNAFLRENYPEVDYIKTARLLP